MNKTIFKYLLKKYNITSNNVDLEYKNTLYDILYRLNKYKKVSDIDKQWLQDKKIFKLLEFINALEKEGDFSKLYEYYFLNSSVKILSTNTISTIKHNRNIHMDNSKEINTIEPIDITQVPYKYDKYEYRTDTPKPKNKKKTNKKKQKISQKITEKTPGHNLKKPHMPLYYKQKVLEDHIKKEIIDLKPSKIPKDISSLFLTKIWETINKSIQKDIEELYKAYENSLWTSAILMAYRTLENILKVHIKSDLKKAPGDNIAKSIQILEENNYDPLLLKKLSSYKDERNEYMHGNKRAGAGEVKKIVGDIISITMHIHNIKP